MKPQNISDFWLDLCRPLLVVSRFSERKVTEIEASRSLKFGQFDVSHGNQSPTFPHVTAPMARNWYHTGIGSNQYQNGAMLIPYWDDTDVVLP